MAAYSEEEKIRLFNEIIDLISNGLSVRKSVIGKVAQSTFFLWMAENSFLSEQYAKALEMRQELLFDELIDIADENINDPARDRLRVDTRKWVLGRMNPKKYSDKLDIVSDGDKIETYKIIM